MNTLQSFLRGYFLHQNYKFVANWNEKMSLVAAIFSKEIHSLKKASQKIEHFLRLLGTLSGGSVAPNVKDEIGSKRNRPSRTASHRT